MIPDWFERVLCALRGHYPDVRRKGEAVWYSSRRPPYTDPEKTRCMYCHHTMYVRHGRRHRPWAIFW